MNPENGILNEEKNISLDICTTYSEETPGQIYPEPELSYHLAEF